MTKLAHDRELTRFDELPTRPFPRSSSTAARAASARRRARPPARDRRGRRRAPRAGRFDRSRALARRRARRAALGAPQAVRVGRHALDARGARRARVLSRAGCAITGAPLGEILEHGTWLDRDDVEALLGIVDPRHRRAGRPAGDRRGLAQAGRLPTWSSSTRRRPATRCGCSPPPKRSSPSPACSRAAARAPADPRAARARRPARGGRSPDRARWPGRRGRPRARSAIRADDFRWVTLPEQLSVAESEDGLRRARSRRHPRRRVIVNRVLPDGPPVSDLRSAPRGRSAPVSVAWRAAGRRGARRASCPGCGPGAARCCRAGADRPRASRRVIRRRRTDAAFRAAGMHRRLRAWR